MKKDINYDKEVKLNGICFWQIHELSPVIDLLYVELVGVL